MDFVLLSFFFVPLVVLVGRFLLFVAFQFHPVESPCGIFTSQ